MKNKRPLKAIIALILAGALTVGGMTTAFATSGDQAFDVDEITTDADATAEYDVDDISDDITVYTVGDGQPQEEVVEVPAESEDSGIEDPVVINDIYVTIENDTEDLYIDGLSDDTADVETAEDWEATLPEGLTGVYADDLIAVAQSQLGYRESESNYRTNEAGVHKGYTRYGAWYGNEYADWSAMFASFCLYYAGVPTNEFPESASCMAWVEALGDYGLYKSAGSDYEPAAGDIVFFNNNEYDVNDINHAGIIESASDGVITTIEGNSSDMVKEHTYDIDDDTIVGFGVLPPAAEETEDEAADTGADAESEVIDAYNSAIDDTVIDEPAAINDVYAITNENGTEPYADGLEAFAIYSADDYSLTFYADETVPVAGSTYNDKTVTNVYTGIEDTGSSPPWNNIRNYVLEVIADPSFSNVQPKSTQQWFYDFWQCGSFDLSNLNTSSVTNMSFMFDWCDSLTEIDVSGWDTSNVTNMGYMFEECYQLETIYSDDDNFVTSAVTSGGGMFYGCTALVGGNGTAYSSGNTSYTMAHVDTEGNPGYFTEKGYAYAVYCEGNQSLTFAYGKVPEVGSEYNNGYAVTEVYTGFENESSISGASDMWHTYNSSITNVIIDESFNKVQPISLEGWFYSLKNAQFYGLKYIDTSNVTSFYTTFDSCSLFTDNNLFDISEWNVSNAVNFSDMFLSCTSLTDLSGLASWDMSSAKNLAAMFYGCRKIKDIDALRYWTTESFTSLAQLFYGCSSLKDISALSFWETSNVTSLQDLFNRCTSLTSVEAIKDWDVSNVKSFKNIFYMCTSLAEVNLSSWDTKSGEDFGATFYNCQNLKTLDISSWDTSKIWLEDGDDSYLNFATNCTELDWIKIGGKFTLFTVSISALVSQQYWYSDSSGITPNATEPLWYAIDDSNKNGKVMSTNNMIGISGAGKYWTHTTGGITVNKVDADTNEPLEGAEFTLTSSGLNNGSFNFSTDEDGQYTIDVYADSDGYVTLYDKNENVISNSNVSSLDCTLTETKAPDGYTRSSETKEFTVSPAVGSNLVYSYMIENEALESELVITKTADKDVYYVGDTVTYTITVEQLVDGAKTGSLHFEDLLPSEVSLQSATADKNGENVPINVSGPAFVEEGNILIYKDGTAWSEIPELQFEIIDDALSRAETSTHTYTNDTGTHDITSQFVSVSSLLGLNSSNEPCGLIATARDGSTYIYDDFSNLYLYKDEFGYYRMAVDGAEESAWLKDVTCFTLGHVYKNGVCVICGDGANGEPDTPDITDGVIIDTGPLSYGETLTVTIVCTAIKAGTGIGNYATVQDLDNGNKCTDSATIDIIADPELKITKTADKDVYYVGDTVTYTITIEQTVEGATATGIYMDDSPPLDKLRVNGISGNKNGVSYNDNQLNYEGEGSDHNYCWLRDTGTLEYGDLITITITCNALEAGTNITNTAYLYDSSYNVIDTADATINIIELSVLPNAGGVNTLIAIIIGSAVIAAAVVYDAVGKRRKKEIVKH